MKDTTILHTTSDVANFALGAAAVATGAAAVLLKKSDFLNKVTWKIADLSNKIDHMKK